ncbi:hypothetical protein [Mycobacterium sp.]|uniref:hypothetical protein n=1 Tax=Mycobacterium sp. TaxID=1785 RepID=UPI003F9C7107
MGVDVWPSRGTKERLAAELFDASNSTGPMRYELWRGDSSVRLVQPDGKAVVIRDERIGRFFGRSMAWEL